MDVYCSVCQNNSQVSMVNRGLMLYRCASCAHVFKKVSKDEQQQYTEDYFLKEHKNWFSHPNYKLFEFIYQQIINRLGDRKIKLLDVGCGNGDFLKYLKSKDNKIELYGMDLIDNHYPGINFIKGDILNESLDKEFDVITSLGVIEHVDSVHSFVRRLNEILVGDGLVFIMSDDDRSMVYRTARLFNKIGMSAAYNHLYSRHNLQCFSRKSLKKLLEMNSFDVILEMSHNYPLKAIDLPQSRFLTRKLNLGAAYLLFFLSDILKNRILQTVVCKKSNT